MTWRAGTVVAVTGGWGGPAGAVTLAVALDPASDGVGALPGAASPAGAPVRALAYPAVTGTPASGDRVLLNTRALDAGLGTGGYALVVALPDRLPTDPAGSPDPAETGPPDQPGHLVKERYSPLQQSVAGADEQGSPWHELLRDADELAGMPVVVADLHSALPAVLAGIRDTDPGLRVAYVMTDGGALPLAFSRSVAVLRAAGWLAATVTTGQAWGGDLEAVTVHTGLLAARLVAGADIAVVAQGPGNLGTGTRWGFSGVSAGEAVNAVGILGGRPVAALRVSAADPRPRHRGVSHHSLTAYGRVAMHPADVVVPVLTGPLAGLGAELAGQAGSLADRHRLVRVATDGLAEALAGSPTPVSSMGRDYARDPACFLASAAAGRHAARLLAG